MIQASKDYSKVLRYFRRLRFFLNNAFIKFYYRKVINKVPLRKMFGISFISVDLFDFLWKKKTNCAFNKIKSLRTNKYSLSKKTIRYFLRSMSLVFELIELNCKACMGRLHVLLWIDWIWRLNCNLSKFKSIRKKKS